MRIQLLRNTVADGRTVGIGQIVEVTDGTGKALVQMGKAIALPEPVAQLEATIEPSKIELDPQPLPQVEERVEMAAPPPTRRSKKGSK